MWHDAPRRDGATRSVAPQKNRLGNEPRREKLSCGRIHESGTGGGANLFQPGGRDGALHVFVRELPGLQGFVARVPAKEGSTIVDQRRKTDPGNRLFEHDQTQLMQFRNSFLQVSAGNGELFLDLITALTLGPI